MINPKRLETDIYRLFSKKHGLKINKEASVHLVEFFNQVEVDQENVMETLDFIAKEWIKEYGQSTSSGNSLIEKDGLEYVIQNAFKKKSLQNSIHNLAGNHAGGVDLDDEQGSLAIHQISSFLSLPDMFSLPKYDYTPESKTFHLIDEIKGKANSNSLLGDANSQSRGFQLRYKVLKQRISRHDTFSKRAFASSSPNDLHKITPIIHLKGKSSGFYLLFGMLTTMGEGKYFLEDLDALIPLSFSSEIVCSDGIFTRNCFVLAEGEFLKNGTFRVDVLSNPLMEPRLSSREHIPSHIDLFGGPKYEAGTEELELVLKIEENAQDATIILISDVWLDQPKVFDKLRILFEGYSQSVTPLAFVFIGNFQSAPFQNTGQGAKSYRESFDQLASLIGEFPSLSQISHFILVPGMNDPWAGTLLPRPPIPTTFTAKLSQKVKNIHFASNPCRIKYCTKEIVIFREDLMNSMRRNAVLPVNPSSNQPLEYHMARTILDQSYLVPLPNEIKPVYWNQTDAMMLYPQPHLLVLADRYEAFEQVYAECNVVNPGQFPNSEFQFMVYWPASGEVEYSRIPS